jgi:hypothetical protein
MAKAPASSDPKEPANLQRNIQAKRPALGHVVPKSMRVQGGTLPHRSEPEKVLEIRS